MSAIFNRRKGRQSNTNVESAQSSRPNRGAESESKRSPRHPDVRVLSPLAGETQEALALRVLKGDEQYAWLFAAERDEASARVLLDELSRLPDEATLREAASVLCETRPDDERAIAMVRHLRQNMSSASPVSLELANVMLAAAERYLSTHSDTTRADISQAMETVSTALLRPRPASG